MTDRIEYRYAALEFRDDGAVITGVAMPYGTVARIMGAFDESVEPGAFGDVAGLDVILNRMHLRSEPIARTGKGGLTLTDSSTELRLKAEIPSYRGDHPGHGEQGHPGGVQCRDAREGRRLAVTGSPHREGCETHGHRPRGPRRLRQGNRRHRQAS